jgi:hypothetical protein
MSNQTNDYIVLKPISDRFKKVAQSISDEEIKTLIKEELRKQIQSQVDFGFTIADWVDTMLEDDESWVELVSKCMKECIKSKFR